MENIEYYNPNPLDKGEKKQWKKEDCSVRAFCCALKRPWTVVFQDLCKIALEKFDMPNSDTVVAEYAKQNGLQKKKLLSYLSIKDFARIFDGTFLCRVRNHIVCVKDHKIYDTWDCSRYKVKTYYKLME
jgi:hypothetical protein